MKALLALIFFIISLDCKAWTFTLSVKRPNHSVLIKEDKEIAQYHPNASLHLGVKVTGPFFFFKYGWKVPGTNYNKSDVGNDSYSDARIGIYFGNFYNELFYKSYVGFSSNEQPVGCTSCYERSSLSSRESTYHALYAVNPNFSMRSLVSQGGEKVSQAGSFLIHAFATRLKIRENGPIIQGDLATRFNDLDDVHMMDLRQGGAGLGFGVLWPFSSVLYMGGAATAGLGVQENDLQFIDGTSRNKHGTGTSYYIRIQLGTHGFKWNWGLKGYIHANLYNIGNDEQVASANYSIRLYSAYTF